VVEEQFYTIAKEIVTVFGKSFASRPYIAILDALGTIHYMDKKSFETHINFIQDFVKNNFNLLKVGDHSLPLGGINLAIFKVSEKAAIAILTSKGYSGQLLAFKPEMFNWSLKIDALIGDIDLPKSNPKIPDTVPPSPASKPTPSTPAPKKKTKLSKKIPFLLKELGKKTKLPMEALRIFQFCDGQHSVDEICAEAKLPKVKVNQILLEYSKKKWIEIKKVII
jgi:hypothetical protein